jgi:EAL domain-containing protein (putative c-di-GMP-specific phosphodiesterase class I)
MPLLSAWNTDLARSVKAQHSALEQALRLGQIRAHFQPQISAQSGALLGCEALARWHHPTRGLLSPAAFLPQLDACGLTRRLGEVMVQNALTALRDWDRAGVHVPMVAVNFTQADLTRPHLALSLIHI